MITGTLFILLAAGILIGIPIAEALIFSTAASAYLSDVPMSVVSQKLVTANDSFPLMAIPLFILAGSIMSGGGVSKRLVDFADACVGWIAGGLGIVANIAGIFFSAISGSSAATSAAVGSIMMPEMEKRGYTKDFSTAIIAASGQTGIIIPPSVTMVVYGVIAGASIGDLFLGGIIPGLFMGGSMCVMTYYLSKKQGMKSGEFKGMGAVGHSFVRAISGLIMPLIILGGIYGGVFTPTEAAAVAVLYGAFVGIVLEKELTWGKIVAIIEDSVISSATIMIIMNAAGLFSWLLTNERIPVMMANLFVSLTSSPLFFLFLVNILLLGAGAILNPSAAVTILAPILVPVARQFGISPVFFGVLMVVNLAIGSLTPPVGTGLFVASSIAGIPLERVAKAAIPYMIILLADLILLILFPEIIMLLPNLSK